MPASEPLLICRRDSRPGPGSVPLATVLAGGLVSIALAPHVIPLSPRSGYRDGHVRVRLAGSCEGCSQSTQTLQLGVERMLQHYVTDVDTVEAVENTPMDVASNTAFEALEQRLAQAKGDASS